MGSVRKVLLCVLRRQLLMLIIYTLRGVLRKLLGGDRDVIVAGIVKGRLLLDLNFPGFVFTTELTES